MSYSQKYTLVHFISPVKNGVQFHMADWLPHVTLADVFAVDRHGVEIDAKLTVLLSNASKVKTKALSDSVLGMTSVVLVDKTAELQQLHIRIVALLEENGALFNTPGFTKDGFIPHSTIQKTGRIYAGDDITIDSVSLVDMFPEGDWQQRKVLATFHMKY